MATASITNLDDFIIGQKVAGCLVQQRIGQGGMAIVYRAVRDHDEAEIALKLITQQVAESDNGIARFEREARLMQSLNHPNILPVYEFGSIGSMMYLTMKIIMGGSLDALTKQGPLAADVALHVLEQLTSALDYAHDLGVVHRDLKPANILLDEEGNCYLTDFGIAKWKEESVGLTLTGMVLGTPGYMAPEQWRTEPVDRRTDVYALGVMAFRMLTGRLPFSAETPFSLMYKHLDQPPPFATEILPDLEPSIDYVLQRALQKEKEFRYQTAGDFFLSLKDAVGGELDESQVLMRPDQDESTHMMPHGGPVDTTEATLHTEGGHAVAVAVGARALLTRAREALREARDDKTRFNIASSIVNYVQSLQDLARQEPVLTAGPYKALESYDVADNRLFFGRETAIDEMLDRAPFSKFTVLHAESGAGKTSLIRAGLLPRFLAGGFLPIYVPVRVSTPQDALKRLLFPTGSDVTEISLDELLGHVAAVVGTNREIFIFFDQFETFFTDVFTDEQRNIFIRELGECLDNQMLQVRVILAMRTEYFGLVASFQPHIAQPFEREYLLRRLKRDEAERALLLPAKEQGYTFEEGLADRILDDLADENNAIAPPQLQLVGTALVESLEGKSHFIRLSNYDAAGGAEGVLGSYLKRMIDRLPVTQREIGRIIVENLVREDETRAVRTYNELETIVVGRGKPTDNLAAILSTLREGHVLRLLEMEHGPAYELVHDYLAKQIQVDPETATLRAAQELLERRLRDYQQVQSLLTPEELSVINANRQRLGISPEAETLINKSEQTYRSQRRRTLVLIGAAVVGIIGVLIISLFFVLNENANQRRELNLEQEAASERDEKLIQESERLAILVEDFLDVDPMVSLNLALEGVTPITRPQVPSAEFALSLAVQSVNEIHYLPFESNTLGVIWSPDQSQLIAWSLETIRVVDATSGETIAELATPEPALSADFSDDGNGVLIGYRDGRVAYYDYTTTSLTLAWEEPTAFQYPVRGIAWQAELDLFLVWSVESPGFNNGAAALWNTAGQQVATLEGTYPVVSHDNSRIATRDNNQQIHIFNVEFNESNVLIADSNLDYVAWASNNQHVITLDRNGSVQIWDITAETSITLESEAPISIIAVSQDDAVATVVGEDVVIWDAISGEQSQSLIPNDTPIESLHWHPADSHLLAFGQTNAITLWNATTWERMATPDFDAIFDITDNLQTAQWSPSGNVITLTAQNTDPEDTSTIMVFDATSGGITAVLRGHTDEIIAVEWNDDENQLASVGRLDQSVRVWQVIPDINELQFGERIRFEGNSRTLATAWNPNETLVASSFESGVVQIWNTSGELLHTLEAHTAPVDVVVWSPDGQRLATGSDDGNTIIWDVSSGEALHQLLHEFDGQAWKVWSIEWNADGSQLVTTSDDGAVRVWDAETGEQLQFLAHSYRLADDSVPGTGATSASWGDDDRTILASSDDGAIRVWDVESGEAILTLQSDFLIAFGSMWNADESQILVWGAGFFDNALAAVFDVESGELLFNLTGHTDWIISAAWSPDERTIVSSGRDTTIRLWDAESGEQIYEINAHTDSIPEIIWSPDGQRFMSRSVDGSVRIWETESGLELYRVVLGGSSRPTDISWNKAGNQILVGVAEDNRSGTTRIINTQNDLDALISYAQTLITRPLTPEQERVLLGR